MMLYPPRKDGEPARPFEIYWGRANVAAGYKGDPLKRVCFSLNNMSISKALTYTYNLRTREGYIMYEILKEAQDYAAKEVEFPDNMHIAECFSIEFKTEFMPIQTIISKVKSNEYSKRTSFKNAWSYAILTNIFRETSQTATFYYAKANRLKIVTC